MTAATIDPTTLPEDQTEAAGDAARALAELLKDGAGAVRLQVAGHTEIVVPEGAVALFAKLLSLLASGDGVAIVPEHAELSTQQAADMLNVSRPFLVALIDEHKLPARKVGTHRRVLLRDLLAYRRQQEAEREAVMQELAEQAQRLGLGY